MKTYYKFLLRTYFGPFVFTFFIALFILLMQFVWKYVDDLVGKGLEWYIIVKLLLLVSVTLVSLALPLAVLLSSLMTFGNLGESNELTAFKASGISLQKVMRPLFLFCALLSVFAFYFSNNLLPVANLKMRALLHDVQNKRPELNIKPGVFNSDIDGYVIKVGNKSQDGKILEDVIIYDHTSRRGNDRIIIAERGEMKLSDDKNYLSLTLVNGSSYKELPEDNKLEKKHPMLREKFEKDVIMFDLSVFKMGKTDESLFKKNYQMLNLKQLQSAIDTMNLAFEKERRALSKSLIRETLFEEQEKGSAQRKKDSIEIKSKQMNLPDLQEKIDIYAKNAAVLPAPDVQIKSDELINQKEVLPNFNKLEQLRIFEIADNIIRSNKNTLEYSMQSYRLQSEQINRYEIEWHRKFTLSFACIVLFLIGAPLGAIVRKGGLGMPVVFSVIFFVIFHMISITGEKLARESVLSPFEGMWLSSLVLLPVGLFLTYKATTDSALFDWDAYLKFFKKSKT